MTGALLPDDADAIVPVEWTDGGSDTVRITCPAEKGHAVRRAGDDAKPGDLLLPAGTRLGPAQIGVLAAAGQGAVLARRRPRVTVISTGNELSEPGSTLVPGLIWDSNSYMLAAAARQAGCDVIRHAVVRDDPAVVLAAIELAAATADLLITSGGVSMGGEHDAVKAALTILGTVTFRKVAMQPGMPQGFGLLGSPPLTPIFTLPGNPVSALVSFRVFVQPAVRALQDLQLESMPIRRSRLAAPATSPAGRRSFLRGILDPLADVVTPLTGQGSHQIASLAKANVLFVVPEHVTALPAGAEVDIVDLP
jgi:molybdopterin molybdotransferase